MTYAHKFTPLRWRDGVPIVAAESHWRLPAKWDREAVACPDCHKDRRNCGHWPKGMPTARPRVIVDCDPFVEWYGPITDAKGVTQSHVEGACEVLMTMHDIRRRLFAVIDATPNLDWAMFTSNPEKATSVHLILCEKCGRNSRTIPSQKYCGNGSDKDNNHNYQLAPRPNLWLGVDITTQREADERIPQLLKIPAAKRVVRVRPGEEIDFEEVPVGMFGPLRPYGDMDGLPRIDAVIVEGTDKPLHPDWVRSLRDQAIGAGCEFYDHSGRVLDGRTWEGVPG